MNKPLPIWLRPWFRVVAGLIVLILLGGAVGGIYLTQQVPEQPIQFPHSFHVGAGIVADSIPEAEYEETLAKAAGFLAALQPKSRSEPTPRSV